MGVPRTIQSTLSKGDFEALEDEWLRRAAEDPTDLDTFISVARALVGTDEEERARFLLGMLDEELVGQQRWELRLKLLRRIGELVKDKEDLHPAILETLHHLYDDSTIFDDLVDAVGLEKAPHDIPKTWKKVERFEGLVVFDVGSVVEMEGRGVGRVVEANRELESFKVDLEGFPGLTVGFRAAAKLLNPLPRGHVLRRKLEEPAELKSLADDDPPALLREVLTSFARPMKAGEVRQALSGVVADSSWTSFWNAARKHPQVVARGSGARQTYAWVESQEDAVDAVWDTFEDADPRKRIELLKREGSRDEALQKRMAKLLEGDAAEAREDDPGLAFEIWFALERALGAPEDEPWSPDALLAEVPPRTLFEGIRERLIRERAYVMYRERQEDWPEVYQITLGQEEDPRGLNLLADGLAAEAPDRLSRALEELMTQPHKAPAAFVWMAERAAEDEDFRERNPLRLFTQILHAVGRDEFKTYRTRLQPLADSGGTLPRLLSHLDPDQAPQAENAIQRAAALESYQRDQLVEALRLRFSGLAQEEKEEPLYATPENIEAKKKEFQKLIHEELPANRKAIEEARALGDLRENFEYKSARQRHEYLSSLATQLEGQLSRVQPIRIDADPARVRLGTRARLENEDGGERTLTILGPWESDPDNDVISYQSDLGKELLGTEPGDTVTVGGTTWTVRGVERWR